MKILVAVAWPYANGPRHIGHVAGFGVPADVFARFMRMRGHDVLMVSGTDEHGTPIVIQAEQEGMSPKEFADLNNEIIVRDLTKLGLSYDLFTRTTTLNHYQCVQEIFLGLYRNGYVIKQPTEVAISPSTGRTLPDRYIFGICPKCGYELARGDQCENCGSQLTPRDLIRPQSKTATGKLETPEFTTTEHFFLDLPALKDSLANWLKARTDWRPNVIKYALGLLDDVQPRAITRDIDWGIPIPLDGWRDNPNKRLYVWFEAVIGYLSASIEWARRFGAADQSDDKVNGSDSSLLHGSLPTGADAWQGWWKDFGAEYPNASYYFMGKDNIAFHTEIWPAELLGYAGDASKGGSLHRYGKLNLPTEIVSSEFLTMNGGKFSTSQNRVIYVKDFLEQFAADTLRYYIAISGPENQDTNFTWEEFFQRVNSELVGNWGNLVNRVLSIAFKKFDGIPQVKFDQLSEIDRATLDHVQAGFTSIGEKLSHSKMHASISEIMGLSDSVNQYLAKTQPWKETDTERVAQIIWTAAQCIADINVMLAPFLPFSCRAVYLQLGFKDGLFDVQPRIERVKDLDLLDEQPQPNYLIMTGNYRLGVNVPAWQHLPLKGGTMIPRPTPVFEKIDPQSVKL